MELKKIIRCQMFEQQLTGMYHALMQGAEDFMGLAVSAGLNKEEWEYIKTEIGVCWLPDEFLEQIDSLFYEG